MTIHTEVRYLDEQQTSARLNIPVRTLRKWRLTGNGPRFRKFGASVRYAISDLEDYEEASTRRSTSDPGPAVKL